MFDPDPAIGIVLATVGATVVLDTPVLAEEILRMRLVPTTRTGATLPPEDDVVTDAAVVGFKASNRNPEGRLTTTDPVVEDVFVALDGEDPMESEDAMILLE